MGYEKKQFVRDLSPKDSVDSVFLVKHIALMSGKDGRNYLNLILADQSGDIEGRVWQNAKAINEKVEKSDYVLAVGKVNYYMGRKQLIVSSLESLKKEEINKDDFIVKSRFDPEVMYQELLDIVKNLDDVYIRELLHSIISDNEISRRLKKWYAGKTIHHAYQAGLLEHILSCTKLGLHLSEHYKVNRNYVVAGCVLHDICKIYELTDHENVEYTEEGKLVGHLVKGVELVDRFSYRIKNFPYDLKLHLKHILLSHHGEMSYGSPKVPQTSEAYLVHLIDFMDSKMNSFEMIKMQDISEGHWSNYVRHLDRIVFKKELPYYPELISDEEAEERKNEKKNEGKKSKRVGKKDFNTSPTSNMGDMLKNFKVD